MGKISFIVDILMARVCELYADHAKIPINESIRKFLSSVTYECLTDPETGLCYEMAETVYEFFLEDIGKKEMQTWI
jgi:hypothetical protein